MNGSRYYLYKDSLYFHELYFDEHYKKQSFLIKLPNILISENIKMQDFEKAYPVSFKNSGKIYPDAIVFRTVGFYDCVFEFIFEKGKVSGFKLGI
jgi:hypothetical protein